MIDEDKLLVLLAEATAHPNITAIEVVDSDTIHVSYNRPINNKEVAEDYEVIRYKELVVKLEEVGSSVKEYLNTTALTGIEHNSLKVRHMPVSEYCFHLTMGYTPIPF